jgi:hypothetical protein
VRLACCGPHAEITPIAHSFKKMMADELSDAEVAETFVGMLEMGSLSKRLENVPHQVKQGERNWRQGHLDDYDYRQEQRGQAQLEREREAGGWPG